MKTIKKLTKESMDLIGLILVFSAGSFFIQACTNKVTNPEPEEISVKKEFKTVALREKPVGKQIIWNMKLMKMLRALRKEVKTIEKLRFQKRRP